MIEREDREVLGISLMMMKTMICLAYQKANEVPVALTLGLLRTNSKTLLRRILTTKMDSNKRTTTSMFCGNPAEIS